MTDEIPWKALLVVGAALGTLALLSCVASHSLRVWTLLRIAALRAKARLRRLARRRAREEPPRPCYDSDDEGGPSPS